MSKHQEHREPAEKEPAFEARAVDPSPAEPGERSQAVPVKKSQRTLPWYVETPLLVLTVLLLVGVFQNTVGRQYVVPSGSMEPTLHGCSDCTNDRIFAEKVSYYGSKHPKPGDIIVFEGTDSWNTSYVSPRSDNPVLHKVQDALAFISLARPDENTLVKRVIATGGQTVSCQPGDPGIMVNGKPIDSSYIQQPSTYPVNPEVGSEACGGPYFGPVTVPEGNYFMMGDNRTNSLDSRYHMEDQYMGTIPDANVRGKVLFVFFPFSRAGGLDEPDIQK